MRVYKKLINILNSDIKKLNKTINELYEFNMLMKKM